MSLATLHDTICALSTPPGTSAIAVMRITGADAISIVAKVIGNPHRLFTTLGGHSFHADLLESSGTAVDDVVVTVFRAPHSFTGEDLVEIHTHGSVLIIDLLQHLLSSSGARLAEAGEFSRRAFIHGKITLEHLETVSLRINASSEHELERAEMLITKKYEVLRDVYDQLVSLLALVNAQIDFGESDLVEIEGFDERVAALRMSLGEYLSKASTKAANKGYYCIALVGPPNVGKSSLFNALLQYERSIVSDIPGTTRDYLEAYMILDGFRVKLVDTAGLRDADEEIESRGIELGRSASEQADLVLRITDHQDRTAAALPGELVVHNKSDLDQFSGGVCISAKTGMGIAALVEVLRKGLQAFDAQFSGYTISDSERSLVREVLIKMERIASGGDIALLAEDLKRSAEIIASLLGLGAGEDSLNYIFQQMCIGK